MFNMSIPISTSPRKSWRESSEEEEEDEERAARLGERHALRCRR